MTSGSKRYLIPDDCEKGRPNFKRNRQVWSRREADVLKGRGFKPVRMFIRCVSIRVRLLNRLKLKYKEKMGWLLTGMCLYCNVYSSDGAYIAGNHRCPFGQIPFNPSVLIWHP